MIRHDILALTLATLEDLTNKGTVRRALKGQDAPCSFTTAPGGDIHADLGEHQCQLYADQPFPDWTCTCLKATNCHHIVTAVLAYQRNNADAAQTEEIPAPTHNSTATTHAIGNVFVRDDITIVRIGFPEPVTVRFLQGRNLDYARCTCAQPDPCGHVPLALALADSQGLSLRVIGSDGWALDTAVLSSLEHQLHTLWAVGIETSHEPLLAGWNRIREQCREAGAPNLAELIDTIMLLQSRRAARDCAFEPQRLVALVAELAARAASLQLSHPAVPHRLCAGADAEPVKLARSRMIGMGTEVLDLPDGCEVVAHLVDARSGSPVTIRRVIDGASAHPAQAVVGGHGVSHWGGGQALLSGGRRDRRGMLDPSRYKATVFPTPALSELFAPWWADSIGGITKEEIPVTLGYRGAGAGMCAVGGVTVARYGFDSTSGGFRAEIVDSAGDRAELLYVPTQRSAAGVTALAQFCATLAGAPLTLSGRWREESSGLVVDPMLLVAADGFLQPHVARDEAGPQAQPMDSRGLGGSTRARALVSEALGHVLIAGTDRLGRDADFFPGVVKRLRDCGSSWLAELFDDHSPEAIRQLFLARALW